jgi:hypothetical protein
VLKDARLIASGLEQFQQSVAAAMGTDSHIAHVPGRRLYLDSTGAVSELENDRVMATGAKNPAALIEHCHDSDALIHDPTVLGVDGNHIAPNHGIATGNRLPANLEQGHSVWTPNGRGLLTQSVSLSLCADNLLCTEAAMPSATGAANMTLILTTIAGNSIWQSVHLELRQESVAVVHGKVIANEVRPPLGELDSGDVDATDSQASSTRRAFTLDTTALLWVTVCLLVAGLFLIGLALLQTRFNNLSRMSIVPDNSVACNSQVSSFHWCHGACFFANHNNLAKYEPIVRLNSGSRTVRSSPQHLQQGSKTFLCVRAQCLATASAAMLLCIL